MTDIEKALERCTMEGGHPFLQDALVHINGRITRVACNGKLMLLADAPDGIGAAECDERARKLIERCSAPPTHHVARSDLIAWAGQDFRTPCLECDGGVVGSVKCGRCDGYGAVECDLGHDHECEECDGNGAKGALCAACGATGHLHNAIVPIGILASLIDAHLIGGLFDLLPGDDVSVLAQEGAVAFRGAGWVLIAAPLNDGWQETVRIIAPAPLVTP